MNPQTLTVNYQPAAARDTAPPCVNNRPLEVPGKAEIREYKAMFMSNDEEIGIFSHELVVNCAP